MAAEDVTAEIHGFSEPDSMPTPWAAGLEQLRTADTFWLSTVRPDGRPHVTPMIAVWHAEALWFATGPEERKARNLAENPSCLLTTGRSDLVEGAFDVVMEGQAEQVTDDAVLEPVATAFAVKYPTGPVGLRCARRGVQRPGCRRARARVPGAPGARPGVPQGRSLQPDDLAGLPMRPDAEALQRGGEPVVEPNGGPHHNDRRSLRSGGLKPC